MFIAVAVFNFIYVLLILVMEDSINQEATADNNVSSAICFLSCYFSCYFLMTI